MNRKALNSSLLIGFLIILAGLASAGMEFWAFSSEGLQELKMASNALENKYRKKETQLKTLKNFARNIESIKTELRALNLKLETATAYMPRTYDLSGVLRKFTLLAQNSGMEITSFKPGIETSEDSSFYTSVLVNFGLSGNFTQALVFLDQVARLKRIVKIEKIQIRPVTTTEGLKDESGILLSAEVRAYRFKE